MVIPLTLNHSLGVRPLRILRSLARGLAIGSASSCSSPARHPRNYATRSQQALVGTGPSAYDGAVTRSSTPADAASGNVDTVESVLALLREQGGRVTNSRVLLLRA